MERQGRPPKVKDRWYHDERYRQARNFTPRKLKIAPQFTLDDLYVSPFNYKRRHDEDGRQTYVAVAPDRQPTGIRVLDELLCTMTDGNSDIAAFCRRCGARLADLDGLLFLLTGQRGIEFRQAYQLRLADDLLRYTPLTIPQVAQRGGFGSRVNLYYAYQRDLRTNPTDRRELLRQPGDEDRYRMDL